MVRDRKIMGNTLTPIQSVQIKTELRNDFTIVYEYPML